MKRIHLLMLAAIASMSFTSCSKDDSSKSEEEQEIIDNTVTYKTVSRKASVVTSADFEQLRTNFETAIKAELGDLGSLTVDKSNLGPEITIKTTTDKVSKVDAALSAAVPAFNKAVDECVGIYSLYSKITRDGTTALEYEYKTVTYSVPVGSWRSKAEDGTESTLLVLDSKTGDENDAYLSNNGTLYQGTLGYLNKEGFFYPITEAGKSSDIFMVVFDGGKTDSFTGKFESGTKLTFTKVDLTNECVAKLTFTVNDPDNELATILGESKDTFIKELEACSSEHSLGALNNKDMLSGASEWIMEQLKKCEDCVKSYTAKYPALKDSKAGFSMKSSLVWQGATSSATTKDYLFSAF